ncbi:hypothetical protein R5R35_004800 [Gryllus longicercus]|uniref:Cuticular protein n=1 Tax=Gryllus longicercus TaxID=2509291 RepID=A0AAN9Z8U0_9ORTH
MYRLVVLLALAALTAAQYHNPSRAQHAAILSEQRFLSGDGTFGAAYTQEDGVQFKEEADQDGNRRGSYSYVDPSGQRRTVHYTAGKDGFRASGDHLPVAPAAPHPVPPQPQYQPQPQYNPPPQPNYNNYNSQPQYTPPPQQYNNYNPPQQNYNSIPQQQYNPTTPPPHRFYPPGKLNLNRTPDGFSFSFNKS